MSKKRRGDRKDKGPAKLKMPVLMKHPPSLVDHDKLHAALIQSAEHSAIQFPNILNEILELLRDKSPVQLLASLAAYGLTAAVKPDGSQGKSLIPGLLQHHVELLQAFALSISAPDWGDALAFSQHMLLAADRLMAVSDAYHERRRKSVDETKDEEASTILALQERMRLHTQGVRNWGYISHVRGIALELYGVLDDKFRAHYGFSATEAITVADAVLKIVDDRLSKRQEILRKVLRERSIRQMVRRYLEALPDIKQDKEELIRAFPAGTPLSDAKARILAHSDLWLPDLYTISPEAVITKTALNQEPIEEIFQVLSMESGDLASNNREHFFLDNPAWRRPFIRLNGNLFCPVAMMFFSHIHPIMTTLAEAGGMKETLDRRRSRYLEEKTVEIFTRAFPGAKFEPNAKWNEGPIPYENDLVAVIDRVAVIIEQKAHALSGPGLRGADKSLKKHVQDLIVEPAIQSGRLAQKIYAAAAGDAEAQTTLQDIPLDFSGVDTVVRISVTLDDFSILASSERSLRTAGWIPDDVDLAPTLTLADFGCVVEILDQPALFLHYFAERQRFQRAVSTIADELDFLGFYLMTGFNTLGTEAEDVLLDLTNMSSVVDRYFEAANLGISISKPKPSFTPYFRALIERIQQRARPGWLLAAFDLLRAANTNEQNIVDGMLSELRKSVKQNWKDPKHVCSTVVSPPAGREAAVIFHVFPKELATGAKGIAEELAEDVLDAHPEYRRCIVFSRSAERWDEPYTSVLIATRQA